jgi:transcriptional regulator with XRE-family HTH domain
MGGYDAGAKEVAVPARQQPTIKRRRLGMELRRLREARRLTIEQVAEKVHLSASTISRIENAQVRVRRGEVREILDAFEVGDRERDWLLELAVEALQKSWWHRSYSDLPLPYADFEASAVRNLLYQVTVVPGLLQTEAYARAALQALSPGLDPPNVERRVAFRMERQAHFAEQRKLTLHAVLDEAVLRRPIGGADAMREQLASLGELSKLPNVQLQVLPFAAGAHAGLDGDIAIFEFEGYKDIAYLETTVSDFWVEEPSDVERYKKLFRSLSGQALSQQESRGFIDQVAAEIP